MEQDGRGKTELKQGDRQRRENVWKWRKWRRRRRRKDEAVKEEGKGETRRGRSLELGAFVRSSRNTITNDEGNIHSFECFNKLFTGVLESPNYAQKGSGTCRSSVRRFVVVSQSVSRTGQVEEEWNKNGNIRFTFCRNNRRGASSSFQLYCYTFRIMWGRVEDTVSSDGGTGWLQLQRSAPSPPL